MALPNEAPHLAATPEPPYYAVIFTSLRTDVEDGYAEMSERMLVLAAQQQGFLGIESARDAATQLGITVSYWRSEADIANWRRHAEHLVAQARGRERWYERFFTRVCRVERAYSFARGIGSGTPR